MKIISWNMAAGFQHDPDRHERAWRWLAEQDADVCLVQEVIEPDWARDRWPGRVFSSKYGKPWGSAVLTTTQGYTQYKPTDDQPYLQHLKGAACVAQPPTADLPWLISIHSSATAYTTAELESLPSIDGVARCSAKDLWEIELAIHELGPMLRGTHFIAGGDLNSALLFDSTYGGTENAKLFSNIRAAGFVDLRPADRAEERTFFRARTGPYQLDHVYADAVTAARVASWRFLADVVDVEDAPSDHAPVVVALAPEDL